MTPLPKRRLSSERQGRRRANQKFNKTVLTKCDNCGSFKVPHEICRNCGTYKGQVIKAPKIKTKVTKVDTNEPK